MSIQSDEIALISGGRTENLGKVVFVMGDPENPRLPDLGGAGRPWAVQMVSGPLIGSDQDEYFVGKIGEQCLTPLNISMDQARVLRESALIKIVEQALYQLFKEEWWGEPPDM